MASESAKRVKIECDPCRQMLKPFKHLSLPVETTNANIADKYKKVSTFIGV